MPTIYVLSKNKNNIKNIATEKFHFFKFQKSLCPVAALESLSVHHLLCKLFYFRCFEISIKIVHFESSSKQRLNHLTPLRHVSLI